ncbi:MAG: hypothetical protein LBI01_06565 [Elusimicrobium sp.]|jgi:hypothetical protein|nr:hypothetical protein [Elusimicrobium sp.]
MRKTMTAVAGILVFALCGYFAYNYMNKQSRQKARRAEAADKQQNAAPIVKQTALSDMKVGNVVMQKNAEQAGMQPQQGMPQQNGQPAGMPPQNGGAYNPNVGNPVAEGQMTPNFAAQRAAAPSAGSVSVGDAPVKLIDILSNKTILSIPFSSLNDPTLSKDDRAIAERARQDRMRRDEANRQAKLAEEQRLKDLEAARQRELEAEKRDPSRAIRTKSRISGVVAQEVFIGNSTKSYVVGDTVLGARIVAINGDNVVFSYKGQRFTKKVEVK